MLEVKWLQGRWLEHAVICSLICVRVCLSATVYAFVYCVLCADVHLGVFRATDSHAACAGRWNIW